MLCSAILHYLVLLHLKFLIRAMTWYYITAYEFTADYVVLYGYMVYTLLCSML